jgi:hypothetical protein
MHCTEYNAGTKQRQKCKIEESTLGFTKKQEVSSEIRELLPVRPMRNGNWSS